jgi:hypothetical protein
MKFKVGDRVTWTHTTARGQSLTFSTRSGVVEKIGGSLVLVRLKNGRLTSQMMHNLRSAGQVTELTEFFQPKEGQ